MRIVITGTSGAGKTTLARILAHRLAIPHIELDAINWQANWHDLSHSDPDEFVRRVTDAIRVDSWVVDGNYGPVRDLVWQRATHLIWLDYSRPRIMAQVIARSLVRAVLRTELWAGNRERWSHMLDSTHPIRWAWSTHARRRRETAERLARPEHGHLVVVHLRRPSDAGGAINRLGNRLVGRLRD